MHSGSLISKWRMRIKTKNNEGILGQFWLDKLSQVFEIQLIWVGKLVVPIDFIDTKLFKKSTYKTKFKFNLYSTPSIVKV